MNSFNRFAHINRVRKCLHKDQNLDLQIEIDALKIAGVDEISVVLEIENN